MARVVDLDAAISSLEALVDKANGDLEKLRADPNSDTTLMISLLMYRNGVKGSIITLEQFYADGVAND